VTPKKIDSDALQILTKALGLTGAGSPVTELLDGVVDQSLDVAPIVRRSRTQGVTSGIYTGLMENNHSAGDTETSQFAPYAGGTVVTFPPFPAVMPLQFDIWLLAATFTRTSGTGTVTCGLAVTYPTQQLGFGVDDAGAVHTDTPQFPVAFADTVVNWGGGVLVRCAGVTDGFYPIGMRLPRPAGPGALTLDFSSVSSAAAIYQCMVFLGVFPVSLGQDGLV